MHGCMHVDVCYIYVSHKWKWGRASQAEQNNSGLRSHIINSATVMHVIQQPTHTHTHTQTHTIMAWIISQSLRLGKKYCPQGCSYCVHVWAWVWVGMCVACSIINVVVLRWLHPLRGTFWK